MALPRDPAPARPHARLTARLITTDPDLARTELRRLVERWQQLPLDQALARMPAVRAAAQQLADDVADTEGRERVDVPDLGPAVVMDQLTVLVHDATAGAAGDGPHTVSARLSALRLALA